ncbi:sulfurtransferase TusA family protein [Magnetovibrio sp. PR-2]|uniref:sulfurtransferase TusA family protein n=1 Tax=Magnetovibrio sp. PR-2 TaxID=3120356 RepID=UPI002FCE62D7
MQVKVTKNMSSIPSNSHTDYFLDITGDVCPMTFVRTKLLIEKMKSGETAEVRLKSKEPLENVPRSVREIGHEVVSLEPESADETDEGVHLLVIKKA